MPEAFPVRLGIIVQMRKPHACGTNEWTVVRTGADVRVRCGQCGRTVLMSRPRFVRAVRKLVSSSEAREQGQPRPGSSG